MSSTILTTSSTVHISVEYVEHDSSTVHIGVEYVEHDSTSSTVH
ncbi:hypothetical protein A2U01_0065281, partial [Trifolium medium]|nr:hypothetical protein [Trifolium medium]